jgi:hypothetical protein
MNQFFLIPLFLILFGLVSCAERKKSDNSGALALLYLSLQCKSVSESASSIESTSRTQYNFSKVNVSDNTCGFTLENITNGLTGTSADSKIGSSRTFGSDEVNIEVTYTLNSSSGTLDVIALGSGSGTTISGPGFRISTTDVKYIKPEGTALAFGTGTSPTTTVGESKTLCLEVHSEGGGSHIFGWSGACADVSNRGTYEFEEDDVDGAVSGSKIGFVLNNATITKIIVSDGPLGTAGSLQSF